MAALQLAAACALLGSAASAPPTASDSLFQFTDMVAINGSNVSLAAFKGHVTLVVNVASY
jgi:hypothetical protein